jgi:hypothetical protein
MNYYKQTLSTGGSHMTQKTHFLLLFFVFFSVTPMCSMQNTRRQKKYIKNLKKQVNQSNVQKYAHLSDKLAKTKNQLKFEKTVNADLQKENDSLKEMNGKTTEGASGQVRLNNILLRSGEMQQRHVEQLNAKLRQVETELADAQTAVSAKMTINKWLKDSNDFYAVENSDQRLLLQQVHELSRSLNKQKQTFFDNMIFSSEDASRCTVPYDQIRELCVPIQAINLILNSE